MPFVCRRCLARQPLRSRSLLPVEARAPASTAAAQRPPAPGAIPPPSGAAQLSNRRLISVHGQDAAHFLQGLTTGNLRPEQTRGLYSAFLTAQVSRGPPRRRTH